MQANIPKETAGAKAGGEEWTPREPSLLIDVHDVAALLKCSARHVWRLADSSRMPRPYKVGALCRWDRAAIERWVAGGCLPCQRK
jgi:predicted DNA-binding transcriptional regulator AlpA